MRSIAKQTKLWATAILPIVVGLGVCVWQLRSDVRIDGGDGNRQVVGLPKKNGTSGSLSPMHRASPASTIEQILKQPKGNILPNLRKFYKAQPTEYLEIIASKMTDSPQLNPSLKHQLIMGTCDDPNVTIGLIDTHAEGDERYKLYDELWSLLENMDSFGKIWDIQAQLDSGRIYNGAMRSYFRGLASFGTLDEIRTKARLVGFSEATYEALWGVLDGFRSHSKEVDIVEWQSIEKAFSEAGANERDLSSLRSAAEGQVIKR